MNIFSVVACAAIGAIVGDAIIEPDHANAVAESLSDIAEQPLEDHIDILQQEFGDFLLEYPFSADVTDFESLIKIAETSEVHPEFADELKEIFAIEIPDSATPEEILSLIPQDIPPVPSDLAEQFAEGTPHGNAYDYISDTLSEIRQKAETMFDPSQGQSLAQSTFSPDNGSLIGAVTGGTVGLAIGHGRQNH